MLVQSPFLHVTPCHDSCDARLLSALIYVCVPNKPAIVFVFLQQRALEEKKAVLQDARNGERSVKESFQEKTKKLEVYTKVAFISSHVMFPLIYLLASWLS